MATILIVDDYPTNREFLVTLLGYGGHWLLEAADGAEALALVRAARPDLVIAAILVGQNGPRHCAISKCRGPFWPISIVERRTEMTELGGTSVIGGSVAQRARRHLRQAAARCQ